MIIKNQESILKIPCCSRKNHNLARLRLTLLILLMSPSRHQAWFAKANHVSCFSLKRRRSNTSKRTPTVLRPHHGNEEKKDNSSATDSFFVLDHQTSLPLRSLMLTGVAVVGSELLFRDQATAAQMVAVALLTFSSASAVLFLSTETNRGKRLSSLGTPTLLGVTLASIFLSEIIFGSTNKSNVSPLDYPLESIGGVIVLVALAWFGLEVSSFDSEQDKLLNDWDDRFENQEESNDHF